MLIRVLRREMQGDNHFKKFRDKENFKIEFAESLQINDYWRNDEAYLPEGRRPEGQVQRLVSF